MVELLNVELSKLNRILKMLEKKTYCDSAWHGEGSEFKLRSLMQLCSVIAGNGKTCLKIESSD